MQVRAEFTVVAFINVPDDVFENGTFTEDETFNYVMEEGLMDYVATDVEDDFNVVDISLDYAEEA